MTPPVLPTSVMAAQDAPVSVAMAAPDTAAPEWPKWQLLYLAVCRHVESENTVSSPTHVLKIPQSKCHVRKRNIRRHPTLPGTQGPTRSAHQGSNLDLRGFGSGRFLTSEGWKSRVQTGFSEKARLRNLERGRRLLAEEQTRPRNHVLCNLCLRCRVVA